MISIYVRSVNSLSRSCHQLVRRHCNASTIDGRIITAMTRLKISIFLDPYSVSTASNAYEIDLTRSFLSKFVTGIKE